MPIDVTYLSTNELQDFINKTDRIEKRKIIDEMYNILWIFMYKYNFTDFARSKLSDNIDISYTTVNFK